MEIDIDTALGGGGDIDIEIGIDIDIEGEIEVESLPDCQKSNVCKKKYIQCFENISPMNVQLFVYSYPVLYKTSNNPLLLQRKKNKSHLFFCSQEAVLFLL